MPAVSVIMAAYNVEQYLEAAIGSVRAQTMPDFELLIVDDGSTDRTSEIAQRHADADPRVRVFRQNNRGLCAARNVAMRQASAPVFAILDSDDLWCPRFLEAQLAVLQSRPEIDVVSGNAWFLGGSQHGRVARPCPDPRPVPDLAGIITDECAVFIMSLLRRRVYDTVGEFDESLRTNEDYDYWLRAAVAGFRFARNDEPLGYYRRRDDSLSASEVRMLRGILLVYGNRRPDLAGRVRERDLLDKQIARFEAELSAAEARAAIEQGDFVAARTHLAMLRRRRGGALVRMAHLMARWTPALLSKAYHLRHTRHAVSLS